MTKNKDRLKVLGELIMNLRLKPEIETALKKIDFVNRYTELSSFREKIMMPKKSFLIPILKKFNKYLKS